MAKILLVDDNALNRELILDFLQDEHEIVAAESAERGLELIRAAAFDLILMDLSMPGMNGFDAIQALKDEQALAAIPVIVISAHAMREDRERLAALGVADYLTKPLDLRRFQRSIQGALGELA